MMLISEKKLKLMINVEVAKQLEPLTRQIARDSAELGTKYKGLSERLYQNHEEGVAITAKNQQDHMTMLRSVLENECIQAEALTVIAALLRKLLHRGSPKPKAKKLKANA